MGGPGLAWNTEVNLWRLQHNSAEEGRRLMSAVAVVCKRMAAVDEWAWRPSLKNKSPIKKLSWKPHMVLGAILAAGVPIAAVAWKTQRGWQQKVATSSPVAQDLNPISKDTHETNASRPATRQVNDSANNAVAAHSFGALQSWFESSANPFLTTAQAKDRKLADAMSKVESALLRQGDVESVFILVHENSPTSMVNMALPRVEGLRAQTSTEATAVALSTHELGIMKPKVVVSIRMRSGSLPVTLVDTAGSLLSAALVNVNAEDVEVLDERSGTRVRARSLDYAASTTARDVLALANESQKNTRDVFNQSRSEKTGIKELQQGLNTNTVGIVVDQGGILKLNSSWWWASLGVFACVAGIVLWWKKTQRSARQTSAPLVSFKNNIENTNTQLGAATTSHFEFWSAPLACALHKCVAEKPALIAATLVERLEDTPTSRYEAAILLMELEPWAAERILSVLPNHSLDLLEKTIRQPTTPVVAQHVRALAEAVLSLRNAA